MTRENPISRVDRDALQRALARAKSVSASERERFTNLEKRRGWLLAAKTASYSCQVTALRPRPWQPVPSDDYVSVGDDDGELGPIGGRRAAGELLRRLLEASLSRYEPDPLVRLEGAEANRAAATA